MFILQGRKAVLDEGKVGKFNEFLDSVPDMYQPIVHPALKSQAEILGLETSSVHRGIRKGQYRFDQRPSATEDGEVFTDGTNLFVVFLERHLRGRHPLLFGNPSDRQSERGQDRVELIFACMGPELDPPGLTELEDIISQTMGARLERLHYVSSRFQELKDEGREAPVAPSEEEAEGARILSDRATRTLALAIKASRGLLVRDLPRQLPEEDRNRADEIHRILLDSALIESEIVVVCSKAQVQTMRLPSKEFIDDLSKSGLKCACGRPIADEQIEEALRVTDRGRTLLEKSRWMTVLLLDELAQVGVLHDDLLIDQHVGGDEVDCIANINGEAVLFELKDKEFSLGNAYSFGAKLGIVRPEHSVVFTTEHVGNDARDHFERARLAKMRPGGMWRENDSTEILYIEGTDLLRTEVRKLLSRIYAGEAARMLEQVLRLASLDAWSLVSMVTSQEADDDYEEESMHDSQGSMASVGAS